MWIVTTYLTLASERAYSHVYKYESSHYIREWLLLVKHSHEQAGGHLSLGGGGGGGGD